MFDTVALEPAFTELGRRRRHPRGSILFFEGDTSRDVMLIDSGSVRLERAVADRTQMLELLGPGEWLGEMGVLSADVRSATAVAATPTEVHVLDAAAFTTLLRDRPEVMSAVLCTAARRLARASRRQAELGATDALARVCGRLIELSASFGQVSSEGITICAPLSQADLASWAGISRETAVKSLSTLRDLGWVHTQGRQITLRRPDAVRERAGRASR